MIGDGLGVRECSNSERKDRVMIANKMNEDAGTESSENFSSSLEAYRHNSANCKPARAKYKDYSSITRDLVNGQRRLVCIIAPA